MHISVPGTVDLAFAERLRLTLVGSARAAVARTARSCGWCGGCGMCAAGVEQAPCGLHGCSCDVAGVVQAPYGVLGCGRGVVRWL
jgi:hypothetical protein